MSKKNKMMEKIITILSRELDTDKIIRIRKNAYIKINELTLKYNDQPKEIKVHLRDNILPCISLYYALNLEGISKEKAQQMLDKAWSINAIPKAKAMQNLCKIPGVYKKMPSIFKKVTLSTFGEKQGFKAKFYDTEKTRCKFDMTKCLYCDICKAENVPELIVCFCHTDDVTDGHIHKNLVWNRTKTMGNGNDCCDFDLFVKKS